MLVQNENESDWAQLLVHDLMPLLLPPEDLSNPCLDVLVSDIFSEMILHNAVLGKLSEPWVFWEGLTKAIYALRPGMKMPSSAETSPTSRLERFGLLSSEGVHNPNSDRHGVFEVGMSALWTAMQFLMLAWSLLRAFIGAFSEASTLPSRHRRVVANPAYEKVALNADGSGPGPETPAPMLQRPIVSMKIWSCVERSASLTNRMPWLTGFLSLLQWLALHGPGQVCRTDSSLDR